MHLYLKTKNDTYVESLESCSGSKYLFGVSRDCRMKSAEINTLSKQVHDSLWTIGDTNKFILDTCAELFFVKNVLPYSTTKGDVFIVKKERIPWAWSWNHKNIIMPYKIIHLYVE